jgi:hypothetical protein
MKDPYIERELAKFINERILLQNFPIEELSAIISDVGFSCTSCGKCCTTTHNGHVFLLQHDYERAQTFCPEALIPAPYFEICSRTGTFFVSGYALRAKPDGSCIHLKDNRCTIYEDRFSICRIYPYMLHREPDEKGILTFRQISGLNEHGQYHTNISKEDSIKIARDTISYEEAWLNQMIEFFSATSRLFQQTGERHVRKIYDQQIQRFRKGEKISVQVFHNGTFFPHIMTIHEYDGIPLP